MKKAVRYFSQNEAKEELQKREAMKQRVEEWWQSQRISIPGWLFQWQQPTAVLARSIATLRIEDAAFILQAEAAELQPFWLEYTADKFSNQSPYKQALVLRRLCHRGGRKQQLIMVKEQLADSNLLTGQRLHDIRLRDGQTLIDFHHQWLLDRHPDAQFHDASAWLAQIGWDAKSYYTLYLSLFVAHAVLFEDFSEARKLGGFLHYTVLPAYERVCQQFGVDPLIVQLWGHENEDFYFTQNWREETAKLMAE